MEQKLGLRSAKDGNYKDHQALYVNRKDLIDKIVEALHPRKAMKLPKTDKL